MVLVCTDGLKRAEQQLFRKINILITRTIPFAHVENLGTARKPAYLVLWLSFQGRQFVQTTPQHAAAFYSDVTVSVKHYRGAAHWKPVALRLLAFLWISPEVTSNSGNALPYVCYYAISNKLASAAFPR